MADEPNISDISTRTFYRFTADEIYANSESEDSDIDSCDEDEFLANFHLQLEDYYEDVTVQPPPAERMREIHEMKWSSNEFMPKIHPFDEDYYEDVTVQPPPAKRMREIHEMKWSSNEFIPKIHPFDETNSGISVSTFADDTGDVKEADVFRKLFADDIAKLVMSETNNFANSIINALGTEKSLLQNWKATTVNEIYCFIALAMLMVRNKKLSLKEYWSNNWLLKSPSFSEIMARDRFLLLLRMLHFSSNDTQQKGDYMHKLRNLLNLLTNNFRSIFYPYENLFIDESLVLHKGRLSIKQYIRTKRHRFGIKLFVLCDVKTGYVLDIIVYTGAMTEISLNDYLGVAGSVVMTLLQPYLGKGHSLYTDNWYTSPRLSKELHNNKTNSCGAVRANRREMPALDMPCNMTKGETQSLCTDIMMAVRWMDRREVRMLTTLHTNIIVDTGKLDKKTKARVMKPECINAYNKCMGSVDRSDMMLSSVECIRKTVKWYKKLFFHLIDLCLLNAHTLFQEYTAKKIPFAKFQLAVIQQLLEDHHTSRERTSRGRKSGDNPTRLTERHFPSTVPSTACKKSAMRYCHVCTHTCKEQKKRKESRYMCKECDVGLCIDPCFRLYHTKQNF